LAAELGQGEAERVSNNQPADQVARLARQDQAADECREGLGEEQQEIVTQVAVGLCQDERRAQHDGVGHGEQRAQQPDRLSG